MTKFILHGGYLRKASEEQNTKFCQEIVKDINVDRTIKIYICMYARPTELWEEKFRALKGTLNTYLKNTDIRISEEGKFIEQIKDADVVFFEGGEPDLLINLLKKEKDWMPLLEGKIVVGTSAGAMMLSKYTHALERNNIIDGLGILPIKTIVHWESPTYDVKWEEAKMILQDYKEDLPIYTLKEGEFVEIEK